MNRAQRIAGFISVVFFLVASLIPPKIVVRHRINGDDDVRRRWDWLFHESVVWDESSIDWATLAYEWCVIFIAGAGLIWVLRRPAPAPNVADPPAVP